ncbi:putative epoxide hydrolase [Lachnellula cervina]|uniref:Putative epoxide hydrolase n=1 Tax=Lachnellula cervina TaxID=1316786 RepID=A0A7D8UPR8_9HELO|nr:putative epoxide hydrolase [Lachnellula cervina]
MAPQITPFKIDIPDSALTSVKAKLAVTTFPEEVDFSDDWKYGTVLSDMKRLIKYWRDDFDWRAQEKKLNDTLPQFTTKVDVDGFGELEMHFVHKKSPKPDSIPLLFCHGWPGSFVEVSKILPLLLENPEGPTFHVVAPSLPNFAFSQGVKKPGFGRSKYAEAIHKVMLNLGYDKYVTQGGDWGYSITRLVGANYPTHCLATHLNVAQIRAETLASFLSTNTTPLTAQEQAGIQRTQWFTEQGYGYNALQSSKPSTVGFALRDSPLALLSWIYEKLHDWTDAYPWTDDEVLTWISIYQFSRAGPEASARIYYEATHTNVDDEERKLYGYNGAVKLGLSYFPQDLCVPPSKYGAGLGDLVFERRHADGGHFAAYERPELLVGDLREMFGDKGGAADVKAKVVV